jgi:hypothetical protein
MDSFVLAETFKYLYLLFDEAHEAPRKYHQGPLDSSSRDSIFCEGAQGPSDSIGVNVEGSNAQELLNSEIATEAYVDIDSQSTERNSTWDGVGYPMHSFTSSTTSWNYRCIPKSSTMFTTEGHIVILDPSQDADFITSLFGSTSFLPLDLVCQGKEI